MSKVELVSVTNPDRLTSINANFQKIEDALNNEVLYRDVPEGEPNQMLNVLDMNGKRILNIGAPVGFNDAARLEDVYTLNFMNQAVLKGVWQTGVAYVPFDFVKQAGVSYVCLTAHTAGVFATDLAANRWAIAAGATDTLEKLASTLETEGSSLVGYKPTGASSSGRTVQAKLRESVSVLDWPSLSAAASSSSASLVFPAGTYTAASNLTFSMPVRIEPGAVITVNTGVTLTFNGNVDAGIYQIFNCVGTGVVVFSPAKTISGYAEWWGATPNVNSGPAAAANTSAINKAVVALTRVELLPADYYTDDKLTIAVHGHSLVGANAQSFGGTQGFVTNVYCLSNTATMLQVGPDSYPGSINAMAQGICVRDIQFRRFVAPTIVGNSVGVKMQYVLKARLERVFSTESIRSFEFVNTVACRVDQCEARRSLAGSGAGTDYWYGYYLNGNNSIWGLPGGNASLYVSYTSASCNNAALQASGSSGFYIDQQFTDVFLSWIEAGDCHVGINVQGNGATGTSFGNNDLHISRAIIDTPRLFGVFIKSAAEASTIDIEGLYCAPSGSAASAAAATVYVQDSKGTLSILGGQLLLGTSTLCRGLVVDNSSGVSCVNTQINEATATPVLVVNSKNCNIAPLINNAGVTGGVAVQLSGTLSANIIAPIVKGKANAFTKGIDVTGTSDTRSEYSLTGIDSACINGGSGNKLVRNSVQITATGLSGTNLVSGVTT